ncbi:putative Meckel syndrome type 1 protein isoform X3 [Apostichopus japonicus]|uniref:Putative Meckel syndrome type 1 protein isoform X3 n=1 Tax=Stichopus japonicus TaxID=307972 RepID=A0A2G8K8Y6_STIJA|nr:putative Meckel syndrome type 1 protein isoform X3 [Apostichopus japonicus]
MSEVKTADLGTGYYRSKDPIKNLKIKVNLKKVTGSSLVPTFYNQDDDGAGTSAMEMRPLGSRPSLKAPAPQEEKEEYTFTWQEKVFSRREVQIYSNPANCFGPQEERHHQDILALKEQGQKDQKIISYLDSDRFTSNDEQILATSSPNETASFLTQKMQNVRRRKLGGPGDRGYSDASRRRKTDVVIKEPTEEHVRSAHVLDTPEVTMYIMADLGSFDEEVTEEDEHILCTIKTNGQGVTSLTPDLTRHKDPYIIITNNAHRDSFQYELTLASQPISWREQDRENKMYQELYQRHSEYIKTFVGQEFEMVPANMLRLLVLGEISGLQTDPKRWLGSPRHVKQKEINRENVAYLSHPFEVEMFYKPDEIEENEERLPQWPQIFVEVLSIDSWQRYRTEGYGYITIPSTPGKYIRCTHHLDIQTWRPLGRSSYENLRRFFIGGSPELEDPTYVSVPITHDGPVLSRFGFRTETTGMVSLKLHVMQQSRIFMEKSASRRTVGSLIDRLGGLTMQASVQNVLELFQRARKRMQNARQTLSTVQ